MSDIEQLEAEYKDACWAYVVACARYDKAYEAGRVVGLENEAYAAKYEAARIQSRLHERVKAAVIEGGGG
jgi:hypothetical protein